MLIVRPRAGTWTLDTQPGSSPIADVRRADSDDPATVVARVGGRGQRRVLGYAYAVDDQEVTFVERSDDRSEAKILGRAKGKPCRGQEDGPEGRGRPLCGRLRFTPAAGLPGTRRIYAVVTDNGITLDERLVATYRTTGDPRPPRPRDLRLRRRGNTVIVTWRSPAHLRQDDVRAVLGSGEVDLRIHRGARDRVVLRGIRPGMRLRVTVIARDERLRPSRPAHARLGPRQKQSSRGR